MFLELGGILGCRSLLNDILDMSNSDLLIIAQAIDISDSVDKGTERSEETF